MRLLASQCVFFDAKGRGIISRERERERERGREKEREDVCVRALCNDTCCRGSCALLFVSSSSALLRQV